MSTLFDLPTPEQHPAETAYYAQICVHHTWHAAAEAAMKHLAGAGHPFTADDLRDLLADCDQPTTPNAIGGLFMSWSRQQLITRIGDGTSRAAKRNGGRRGIWIGTRTEAAAA